jgi:hypothetical protein
MSDSSAIFEIYLALEKAEIGKAGRKKITCRGLDDVSLKVSKGELPLRMLLPNTEGEHEFAMAIGSLSDMTWAITDLCLWAPLDAGGRRKFVAPMVRYVKAYVDWLKSHRNPTNLSEVVGFTANIGPQPWADGDYWGVEIQLAVREVF